jgi:hypothetical protein
MTVVEAKQVPPLHCGMTKKRWEEREVGNCGRAARDPTHDDKTVMSGAPKVVAESGEVGF